MGEDRTLETCCRTVRDEETKAVGKTNIGGGVGDCLVVDIREQSDLGKTRTVGTTFITQIYGVMRCCIASFKIKGRIAQFEFR